MSLSTCKNCHENISVTSKICSECGEERSAPKYQKIIIVTMILITAFGLWLIFSDNGANSRNIQQLSIQDGVAKDYSIINQVNYSSDNTERIKIYILSTAAIRKEDRAATVQTAAEAYLYSQRADEVTALLEISEIAAGKGNPLAIAIYTPNTCINGEDRCDEPMWQIESSDQRFTAQEITIMEKWYIFKDSYKEDHRKISEDGFRISIAKKIHIPAKDVSIPVIIRKKITG
ncbi:DUF4875 domain-containing protein [Buttiauxella brennerae]|uniref:DUF4875 domain-containing protein n=1 Tax=Buttiauxella brennerae TaxID=82988 RepID=UPI00286F3835|nr:hypothetical protein [Buttiauxella brennerae]